MLRSGHRARRRLQRCRVWLTPSGRHRPDADQCGATLFHELRHLRRQQGRSEDLDLPAGRVDEPAGDREGHGVDLVAGRTHEQEAPRDEAALRRFRLRGCRARTVLVHVLHDLSRRIGHEFGVRLADPLSLRVLLGVVQRGKQDLVVHGLGIIGLDVLLDDVGRLVLIPGEESLVVARLRLQDRVVAHEENEKAHRRQMLAEDDETDGQRRGEQEADRSPEPGPEDDRHEERDR